MGRPKNISNIYNPPKSNTQFSEGQKSKGILDDSPVRTDIHTKELTINGDPIENIFVPYTGATGNVDLGSNNLRTTGNILALGTTSQIGIGSGGALTLTTIAGNEPQITSLTGNISFDDENLITTGDVNTSNLEIPKTTSTVGQVTQSGLRFIHSYTPTGATGGDNLFVGKNSGNFDMAIDGHYYHASKNVGLGEASLDALTTGYGNMGIGRSSLSATTDGYSNVAVGAESSARNEGGDLNTAIGNQAMFYNVEGGQNTAIGASAMQRVTGSNNVAIGYIAGLGTIGASEVSYNTFIGYQSGYSILTGGDSNIFLGNYAGYRQTTNSDLLIIDNQQRASQAVEATNSIIYGTMDATSTNQSLRINAELQLVDTSTYLKNNGGDIDIYTAANKTIELQQPVYKDINMAGYLLAKPASSAPGIVTFLDEAGADTTIETYGFAIDEKVHGGFELQHDYKEGTDLVFHVHWQGIAAPTGTDNVQWRLNYIVMRDGTTLNAAVVIDSPDTTFDTQYESVRTDFAAITGTNFLIGDQFMFTLTRVTATGDAYAGEALIGTAGIHYQVDTLGSRTISAK